VVFFVILRNAQAKASSNRRDEAEIIIQRIALTVRIALEVLDQRLLHPEYRVLVNVRRALDEETRRQRFFAAIILFSSIPRPERFLLALAPGPARPVLWADALEHIPAGHVNGGGNRSKRV
jgi:hypothetical protein